MIRVPTHREPTHPGDMLLEEFLKPMALSQRDLAEGIHVPYQRVNELVNKKRGMTPSTALRLSKFLGTSADLDEPATSLGPLSGKPLRGRGVEADQEDQEGRQVGSLSR